MGNMSLLSRADRMVCISLELAQTQPLNTLASHTIILALSNDRMSEVENESFSGLDLLEKPLWSLLPLGGHVGIHGPYCGPRPC